MPAKAKPFNKAIAPNVIVTLGLIVMTLLTVLGIVFSWVEGRYLLSGLGIVFIYAMFMGSDVFCRKCRSN
ncbi:MAG: hypothetical protein KTR29_06935 [Rhodothermaceae bacterium]|nr:hypothetical protein [Rhodothermaceae bacterium]